jgi:hypothetical protein
MIETSTEEKLAWCLNASKNEEPKFVEFINSLIYCKYKLEVNPEKLHNIYTADLLVNGLYKGDLKTQDTPFFKSFEKYGIDPQWAITYNLKDAVRYKEIYTNNRIPLVIFFDLKRKEEENYGVKIKPMRAVFATMAKNIEDIISEGKTPLHVYSKRRGDNSGNAKESFVFDARQFEMIFYEGSSLKLH